MGEAEPCQGCQIDSLNPSSTAWKLCDPSYLTKPLSSVPIDIMVLLIPTFWVILRIN